MYLSHLSISVPLKCSTPRKRARLEAFPPSSFHHPYPFPTLFFSVLCPGLTLLLFPLCVFRSEFWESYHSLIPPGPGFARRRVLYQLYYYLNQLNLFGRHPLSCHWPMTESTISVGKAFMLMVVKAQVSNHISHIKSHRGHSSSALPRCPGCQGDGRDARLAPGHV